MRQLMSGIAITAVCVGLVFLPNAFNPHDDGFNRRLPVVWFLGLSLPGLVMALVLGLLAARWKKGIWPVVFTWGLAAFLGVALPAAAFVSGRWADGLTGVYMAMALIVGGVWACAGWAAKQPGPKESPTPRAGAD